MRMIKIAICDDDKTICSQIERILLKYSGRDYLKTEIKVFFNGESLLEYMRIGNEFDLIYLDIEMNKLDGVEVGKQVRKILKNYETEIVYISGKDGYDRKLFDVQPLHFIPKPIEASIVISDLKLALERRKRKMIFFRYQKKHEIFKIPISEIIYFESVNRQLKIVTTKGEDFFYGKLKDVISRMTEYEFIHIHRSYLVNYNHIRIMKYSEIVMCNDVTLSISRQKRNEFRSLQFNK